MVIDGKDSDQPVTDAHDFDLRNCVNRDLLRDGS
jgi:hypothetical protein